ncbi:hypothetical protein, partial [Paraburkholderia sp. GAS448]|uniref:hypothetical protein n=1 Tax=Paraburkholderia sp. GAS448 TaxID=3035136 RepID=UPI003D1B6858
PYAGLRERSISRSTPWLARNLTIFNVSCDGPVSKARAIAPIVKSLWTVPAEDLSATGVAGACLQAANLQPCFGTAILPQQVQGDAPEGGEVLRGIVYANAALVFAKGYIKARMASCLKPTSPQGVQGDPVRLHHSTPS